MKALTLQQQQCIKEKYELIKVRLEGDSADIENVAGIMAYMCPNSSNQELLEACKEIKAGMDKFNQVYESCQNEESVMKNPVDHRRVLEYLTKDMTPSQAKGFYLQSYEQFRQLHIQSGVLEAEEADSASELAGWSEEEMKDMVARQMETLADLLTCDILKDAGGGEELYDANADTMILSVAAYAAGVDGEVPMSFQQQPFMLGVCMAACKASADAVQNIPDCKDRNEVVFKVIAGVVAVVVGIGVAVVAGPYIVAAGNTVVAGLTSLLGPSVTQWLMHSTLRLWIRPFLSLIPLMGIGTGVAAAAAAYLGLGKARSFYQEHTSLLGKWQTDAPHHLRQRGVRNSAEEQETQTVKA